MIRAGLGAAFAIFIAAPLSGQSASADLLRHDTSRLALLDVPFLSQSEALCGGAAAAMVLRYWGERDVAADDFAALVDRSAGGIRTRVLVDALRTRGWSARETTGDAEARAALTRGQPLIALIEDRPHTYHYVVVVGWHDRAVVIHDPARAPFRVMAAAEFDRRWRAADRWALIVLPPSQNPTVLPPSQKSAESAVSRDGGRPDESWDGGSEGGRDCDGLVRRGVALAQKDDLAGAERSLTDAAYRCGGPAAYRELAGVRLLQRRWAEVSDLAEEALRADPRDAYAARLLAAGRMNEHDLEGALAAWNVANEPLIDLVTIDGLQRTRVPVVERYIGLPPRSLLTPALLRRAQMRLRDLPSSLSGTIGFAPVTDRTTELRVTVLERSMLPRSAIDYAAMAAKGAVQREVAIPIASISGGGELLSVAWRFWPERPRYSVTASAPFAIGNISASAYQERQPFSTAAAASNRAGGSVALSQWRTDRVRWTGRIGADRWRGGGTFGALGADVRLQFAHVMVNGGITAWTRPSRAFGAGGARIEWRSSQALSGTVLLATAGMETVSRQAPLDLWAAGDTGHARDSLLRAHPVLDGARLRVDRLGRSFSAASFEARRWTQPATVLHVAIAGFLDLGRTGGRIAGRPLADADVGAGLRVAIPGAAGIFQLNAARGLRDRGHAISLLWKTE